MGSHRCGWCGVVSIVFFIFIVVTGPSVIGQVPKSSLCHIEVSVTPPSHETLMVGETLRLIVTAHHRAPCAIVTLTELGLPPFASGWDGKVDTCGWCSVTDTVLLQPDYGDAGEYSFRFIATSTWGCGLVDTLVYTLSVEVPVVPDIDLSAMSYNYGDVVVGDSADWTLYILNRGEVCLSVTDVTSDNADFAVVSPSFPQIVAPGDSVGVLVWFKPSVVGDIADTLTVTSNDPDEPSLDVSLEGRGTNVCEGPFVLPEPRYTKGLSNTIYWIPAEGAYYQSVCAFDSLNPDSVFGCLELKGKIACETCSTTFENLQDGHCYGYYVNAIFIAGPDTSQIQSNIEYSTQDNTAPETVQNILALADSGGIIIVRWDPVSDAVSYVDSYCVYRKKDGETLEFLICLPADSNEYCDSLDSGSGLIEGKTYYFLVRAVDAVGNMGEGVLSNAVVPDSTPPCKPILCWYEGCGYDYRFAYHYYKGGIENTICTKDMNARPECQGVKLAHWVRFQAARDSLKYFEDEFMPGVIFFDSGWLPYDSLLNDALFCDSECPICHHFDFYQVIQDVSFVHRHEYLYRVQTKDSVGNTSNWSNIRGAVQDAYPPGDISNLFVYAVLNPDTMSGYMDVRWDPAEDLSGIRLYKVYRKIGLADTFAFIADIPGNQTQYIDSFPGASGVDSSTTVCYRIGSIDNVGNERGKWDTQWEACDRCPLGPYIEIVNFGYTDSLGNKYTSRDTASVCWSGYDNEGVVGYKVVVTGIVNTILYQNDPSAECFSIPLPADGEYFLKVQALFTGSVASTWSNSDSIIQDATPPEEVELNVWRDTTDTMDCAGNLYLRWGASQDSTGVDGYRIYRRICGDPIPFSLIDSTSDTCWVDEYANNGDDTLVVYEYYCYEVHPVDLLGNEGTSNPDSDYCNRPPMIVSTTRSGSWVKVCWESATPREDASAWSNSIEVYREGGNWDTTLTRFNETCCDLEVPGNGCYHFRVMEIPEDPGAVGPSDWSCYHTVCVDTVPPPVSSLALQPQPDGRIFVSWLWQKGGYKGSVDFFQVRRWLQLQPDSVVTFIVRYPDSTLMDIVICPDSTYYDCYLDSSYLDSTFCYTVIACDSVGDTLLSSRDTTVCGTFDPDWVYTPDIKDFSPVYRRGDSLYFNHDSLTVSWGWQGNNLTFRDTTFGAVSSWMEVDIYPNFSDPLSSGWIDTSRTYFTFGVRDLIDAINNNRPIYARVKAKDRWGHVSPWSMEYFGLSCVIVDKEPPAPVHGLTTRTYADSSTSFNLIDVVLSWNTSTDDGSGMSHYLVYRDSANTGWGSPIARVDYLETIHIDTNLCVIDTLVDFIRYCYKVTPLDSVGNEQTGGNANVCLELLPPPDIFFVSYDSIAWHSVDNADSYFVECAPDSSLLGTELLGTIARRARSGWIRDTTYSFKGVWDPGDPPDSTMHYHVKAKIGDNETPWSEVVTYDSSSHTDVAETTSDGIPKEFSLSQNYPNPFNPTTEIEYALPVDCQVKLGVYNLLGQVVQTLVDGRQTAGYKSLRWDGRDDCGRETASGIYFCRISAGGFRSVRKMVLLR